MVALHATENPSVHLAVAARSSATPEAVEKALYTDKSVVKQVAMRRTLFVFPRDLLPAVWGSASARVAASQRGQLERDLVRHGITDDPNGWIEQTKSAVLSRLHGVHLSAKQLREDVPQLDVRTIKLTESKWQQAGLPFAPQLTNLLEAEHQISRGQNQGHWKYGRPGWTTTESWLGTVPDALPQREAYAELIGRWLWTFGPGTEADLVWWLGATKSAVRDALTDLNAVTVELDGGGVGYLLPDDDQPDEPVEPWAALLPTLDPTLMGWRERTFYLEPALVPYLFDTNGNGGTTAWVNGRVVGCWVQQPDGAVRIVPARPLSHADQALLAAEAARLTAFLDGIVISNVYASRMMKGEQLP